ncbi:MAG TPA: GAP family protein [Solirubrobacterales bacterium]
MNLEAIVLAVGSAARPAGLAAVYSLLSRGRPGRMLAAYIGAGFAFSAGFGILVVTALHTADLTPPRLLSAIFDLVVGAAALGFAAGVFAGRSLNRSPDDPSGTEGWALRRLREPSVPMAALVGIATHLPGLFYLLALNSIIAERDGVAESIWRVLAYNAIWFGVSVAAVFFLVIRPSAARDLFGRLNVWVRRHQRPIVVTVFGIVGVYLIAHGVGLLAR